MVPRAHFASRAVDLAGDAVVHGQHPGGGVPPRPWTWLDQCHGAEVVVVEAPGQHAGSRADAAATAAPGAVLVVRSADCAPVALLAPEAVAIAHAGWRGLLAGVIERTVEAVRALGATDLEARIGPCIGPERYEFGPADLDLVAARFGDEVRARTPAGRPSLHLAGAVASALRAAGVARVTGPPGCTAAGADRWFSHRARGEAGRQGSFAWLEAGGPDTPQDGPAVRRAPLR